MWHKKYLTAIWLLWHNKSRIKLWQTIRRAASTQLHGGLFAHSSNVEVFDLTGHKKAKRAYAWSHVAGRDDSDERFVAVLEIPPVDSPQAAVKVAIAHEVREAKKK